jgi:hypothetical protein
MNWSQLSRRNKGLAIGGGVLALALVLVGVTVQRNRSVGADVLSSGAPALDSNGFNHTISVSVDVADAAGAAKAAFVDAFLTNNAEDPGVTGDAGADGKTALSLTDGECYTLRAQDKNSTAEGTVEVAVGKSASCGDGFTAYESAASQPIKITVK